MALAENLKTARVGLGWSQKKLADEAGVSQQLVSEIERGVTKKTTEIANLARALGRSVEFLDPSYAVPAPPAESASSWSTVAVQGRIGAGAVIETDFEQENLGEVEVALSLPENVIAFEVVGYSNEPRYHEGDVVVVLKEQVRSTDFYVGDEAAVKTVDGKRYLKEIAPGPIPGVYTLRSLNAPPFQAVLEWVGEIFAIVPRKRVRHQTRAAIVPTPSRERPAPGMDRRPPTDTSPASRPAQRRSDRP